MISRKSLLNLLVNLCLALISATLFVTVLELGAKALGVKPIYGGSKSIFVEDREILWRLRPNCNIIWRSHASAINSLGLRSPEVDYGNAQHPRILIIGDSVTFGDGVVMEKAYPHQLERALSTGTVVNAGVPGYGTIQSYHLLTTIGKRISPDIVILGYCLNDVLDDLTLLRHAPAKISQRRKFGATPADLSGTLLKSAFMSWAYGWAWKKRREAAPPEFLRKWRSTKKRGWRKPDIREIWAPNEKNPLAKEAWALLESSLSRINSYAYEQNARFLVVCFPLLRQVPHPSHAVTPDSHRDSDKDLVRSYTYSSPFTHKTPAPQQGLARLCSKLNIPFLDTFQIFVSKGWGTQFCDKNHLSIEGHSTTAEALAAFLREEGYHTTP